MGLTPTEKSNFEGIKNWVVYKGTKRGRGIDLAKPIFQDRAKTKNQKNLATKKKGQEATEDIQTSKHSRNNS